MNAVSVKTLEKLKLKLGWTWKIIRFPSSDPGFASRVGRSGFFFILAKVSLVPRSLPLFLIYRKLGHRKKDLYPQLSLL